MRYLMIIITATMVVFFVSCAKQNVGYITHVQTAHHMVVPEGIKLKTSDSYYPLPNNSAYSITKSLSATPPSLVPPGSNLQRFRFNKAK